MIIFWGNGKTQNQNESLNAMICNRVPKGMYVGLRQLEIWVYDAVSHYNIGNKAAILVYEKLGMIAGNNMRKGCFVDNSFRIENSRRKNSDILGVSNSRKKIKSIVLKG